MRINLTFCPMADCFCIEALCSFKMRKKTYSAIQHLNVGFQRFSGLFSFNSIHFKRYTQKARENNLLPDKFMLARAFFFHSSLYTLCCGCAVSIPLG